jgi:hypothetical protein
MSQPRKIRERKRMTVRLATRQAADSVTLYLLAAVAKSSSGVFTPVMIATDLSQVLVQCSVRMAD